MSAALQPARDARGFTLVELVVVLAVLGILVAALSTVFVSGSQAEADLNARFQAQQSARLALDELRRDVHCGTTASPSGSSAIVRVDVPSGCATGAMSYVLWCTASVGGSSSRYALWRIPDSASNTTVPPAATCPTGDTGAVAWADHLSAGTVFTYTAGSGVAGHEQLPELAVDFPVNVNAGKGGAGNEGAYELKDTLVLSNGTRS